ncbi:tRNA synthetases class I-domain-containing protein [Cokeromyces recurvatus]|uniref:tRNA synthetases class I-domain-containing protein n=1 Tax=Cokeromyces recurvatus TaxID=90255 RepID=UPI00221F0E56|nr:tRNA synthetases class I-domain-containing protein [Cokeromyces recurvatus]KAI7906731.1 tRNA synthetases class I-domain-containing protein [Cokeromyces recurvatus]
MNILQFKTFQLRSSSTITGRQHFWNSAISFAAVKRTNPYTKTLLLPKTNFPLRAEASKREHLFRDRCTKDLYPWQVTKNNPKDLFVLHDGPPYANGNVHSGHAMNKILKDIINRYKMLQGHKIFYRPGWDCHGLPIELKALEQIRKEGKEELLSPREIRKLAKKKALTEVNKQMASFKSWGIMADWDNPYLTLTNDYEMRQLRVLTEMIKHGHIYRQLKPVYWSPSSRTALAESELEYNDNHISKSIHVRFPVKKLSSALKDWNLGDVYALIWTTTPWTIPANKAISVHPQLKYSLVEVQDKVYYIIGSDRVEAFKQETNMETIKVLDEVLGKDLLGSVYQHPLNQQIMPIIGGEHVTAESGTGLVHTAPDHGMEDYEVSLQHGIKPFGPVDDCGKFTKEAGLGLEGKVAFTEGINAILDMLKRESALVSARDYTHKYPYDWRTKQPIMLRATAQWFANVEHLQQEAVENLKQVRMVPEVSIKRLEQFTLSRKEWCISRQRSWGVPIPALYDEHGEALLTERSVEYIIQILQERGTDAWWEEPDDMVFVAPEYRNKTYKRGYDTMDVWFDSGTSWTLLEQRKEGKPLADVYLEGSDQHRGWFQSSLLTSIAVNGKAPYGALVTHGFVLDEKGEKMSKSLGNTVEPSLITDGGVDKKKNPAYGSDVLRYWVANCEYTRDVSIGPSIIAQISDNLRKIRTTARFLLGNLYDFKEEYYVPYKELQEIDKYMLYELYHYNQRVTNAYDDFAFNKAAQTIQNFTNTTLSSFYFDTIKDRLYNEPETSEQRRMVQTVLYEVLQSYTKSLAPFICHTAEEIYEQYKTITPKPETSIFKTSWVASKQEWNDTTLNDKWSILMNLKGEVNQILESARQEKYIRSSQEADISLCLNKNTKLAKIVQSMKASELSSLFITSHVNILTDQELTQGEFERNSSIQDDNCKIILSKSKQYKCPRCWNYHSIEEDSLCLRCSNVLK